MVIVLGSARVRHDERDELLAAMRTTAEATRRDEGCLSDGVYVDVNDDAIVQTVEVWANREALEAHMSHEHTRSFLAAIDGRIDGEPVMTFHDVADQT